RIPARMARYGNRRSAWWICRTVSSSAIWSTSGSPPEGRGAFRSYIPVTARIAVIDDEAPNRTYLETLLGNAGFHVQAAAGGNEGVALVEKERPDLVLVDLMMPEVDSFMVCERIRKGPAGADIQIVVLSVLDELDGKVRALELGADEYLVKPVESRELVTRIKVMPDRAERLGQQGSQSRRRLTLAAGAKGGI